MINDTIDFDYAISQLLQGTNTDIYLQANVLNSDYMNKSFEQIENTLNTLYEKTRYLEDSIAYTKEFLETKINHFNNEINSVLHEIENVANSSKNLAYISYNVPFVNNTAILSDRDGRPLHPLEVRDNKHLTLGYKKNDDIKFNSCKRVSNLIPYKDNLDSIKALGKITRNKNEAYRAIYLEEQLRSDGLSETITFYFKEPVDINNINISTSNCKVENLKFGLINNIAEYIDEYTIDMPIKARQCVYIQFDLVCLNYELIKYELDKRYIEENNLWGNVWSNIKEFEYKSASMTELHSKFDTSMVISKYNSTKNIKRVYSEAPESIIEYSLFSYIFGIDSLTINNSEFYTDGYMISDPIHIGKLKSSAGEYIRLHVDHNKGQCSEISYSILDGDIEYPITIMNENHIENELLFGEGYSTRFEIDRSDDLDYQETIKQNGNIVDISLNDAQKQITQAVINAANLDENTDNKVIDRYSITYKPVDDKFNFTPLNDTIQIKCYIRTLNKTVEQIPYISSISIRKYGEDSLWTNRY